MAHKLLFEEKAERPSQSKWKLPDVQGRFGLAIFIGQKEVFIGVNIATVETEHIIKKHFIKTPKAKVKTFRFDPLA